MPSSSIKMVVTDMDGTLLNSNHQVSDRFFELFSELNQKGIQFVAASGRQYGSMLSKLHSIQKDLIIIAENGAYVRQQEDELLLTPIGQENIHKILDQTLPLSGANPVLCSKTNAYVQSDDTHFINLLKEYYSGYELVPSAYEVTDEILKVAVHHFEDSEKHIYPAVEQFEPGMKVKVSGNHWVDISHPDANKGYALDFVIRKMGIQREELLIFGDYNNDLEMLEMAHYSYAMANAHPNVKKVANFGTLSNDEQGVEKVLESLLAELS
ncbi:HAD family hydrolase [Aureicoccus marinus]|uniref:Haloacid dehalogenase n=1 Tax=Aureicoccus marinus TaxID=754435 RepID=A0A2S7T7D9_9FLAO|nr:HAD family hydrolase [Aureicoccus marinus]PQJ15488.1 haloacid dehalogenase [Aureicoccus marinus]